jgi:ABC-type lipoprotein release transport system permease subunit
VEPGWLATMKIPLRAGRDFHPDETSPGVAIVNETFAKQYFAGENPVGKSFDRGGPNMRYEIVGVARDAVYRDVREPMLAVAFVPLRALDAAGGLQPIREETFLVRTANPNPLTMAPTLRKEVARAGAGFRVTDVHTQLELVQAHTVRERLLAMLASFFAAVALLLAGIGIYGVLDYSVLQRRREIGILLAVGVPAGRVAGRVVWEVFAMVGAGAAAGSGLGLAAARYVDTLLYGVKPTEPMVLLGTAMTMLAAAAIAAVAPAVRAVRTDPMAVLRVE